MEQGDGRGMEVTLYSRPGCSLCEEARRDMEALEEEYGFALRVVNIDDDPELSARYGASIPVVAIDGEAVLMTRVSRFRFRKAWEARLQKPSTEKGT
jgi:glutaredoxin